MSPTQPPYATVDPATGKVLKTFDTATDDQIAAAVAKADDAYRSWREQPLKDRVEVARNVGELFRKRATDLGELTRTEMGKKLDEGTGEVEFSASIFEFYAEQAEALLADQRIPSFSGGTAVVQRRPVGVRLGVMP